MFAPSVDRRPPDRRRGVAASEFAVCLPVLILLTFGVIEACSVVYLKHSLTVAAYEGAHTGVQPDATAGDVTTIAEAILGDRRVAGGSVVVEPGDLAGVAEGEFFTVRVSAPVNGNAYLHGTLYAGRTLTATATFMKEIP